MEKMLENNREKRTKNNWICYLQPGFLRKAQFAHVSWGCGGERLERVSFILSVEILNWDFEFSCSMGFSCGVFSTDLAFCMVKNKSLMAGCLMQLLTR